MGELATLVPRDHLELTRGDNYFLALSHACEDTEYRNFFRDQARGGAQVILDNSTIETGAPEDFDSYLRKAIWMDASCVLTPDIFMDREATLNEARKGLTILQPILDNRSMQVMLVPQGRSIEEWSYSAQELFRLAYDRFGITPIIGISCRYTEMFGGTRILGVAIVTSLIRGTKIHLLGCYANPYEEAKYLLGLPSVRGMDSSYPTIYTQHGLTLSTESFEEPRPERNIDFINDHYDEDLLRTNIAVWRLACQPYKLRT